MKKSFIKSLPAIALLSVFSLSFCTKNKDGIIYAAEATVYDSGQVALDGCGWLIKIDSTKVYSPTNLSDDYKQNGLKVVINYKVLASKSQCGIDPNSRVTQATITNIHKK